MYLESKFLKIKSYHFLWFYILIVSRCPSHSFNKNLVFSILYDFNYGHLFVFSLRANIVFVYDFDTIFFWSWRKRCCKTVSIPYYVLHFDWITIFEPNWFSHAKFNVFTFRIYMFSIWGCLLKYCSEFYKRKREKNSPILLRSIWHSVRTLYCSAQSSTTIASVHEPSRRTCEYKICAQQRNFLPWLGLLSQTVHLNKYTQSNKIQNDENYLNILSGFDLSLSFLWYSHVLKLESFRNCFCRLIMETQTFYIYWEGLAELQ